METLYNDKEAFALCFRAELPVRGNHTNNFAEAQFLVLKDTILRRVKEYNVVGLIDKVTINLEDHYKDKLLSLTDGSFDGHYRQRFMGRGKDGGTGFKVPNQEEHDCYLCIVEQFTMFSQLTVYQRVVQGEPLSEMHNYIKLKLLFHQLHHKCQVQNISLVGGCKS